MDQIDLPWNYSCLKGILDFLYEDSSKSLKPHQIRRDVAEHFSCGNTLPLLIKLEKLIQIFLVSKCSKPHQERRAIAEHFSCGSTLPLLIKLEKLIQIFLVSKGSKPHQESRVIAEHFCWGNIITLLITVIKLINIFSSFLGSGSVLPQQKCSSMALLFWWGLGLFEYHS